MHVKMHVPSSWEANAHCGGEATWKAQPKQDSNPAFRGMGMVRPCLRTIVFLPLVASNHCQQPRRIHSIVNDKGRGARTMPFVLSRAWRRDAHRYACNSLRLQGAVWGGAFETSSCPPSVLRKLRSHHAVLKTFMLNQFTETNTMATRNVYGTNRQ